VQSASRPAEPGTQPDGPLLPRLLLDVPSVHRVSHVLRELREEGLQRNLPEHVWHRLEDQALLDRED
jgi:hypothetical protein